MKNLKYLIFLVLTAGSAQAITYDEALRTAFRENPGLGVADLGVDEADEQLIQTRAGFSPQVKFSGSYTRLNTVPVMNFEVMPGVEFEVPMGAADNYSAGFSITVPLFLGGKRAWAQEIGKLGVDAAEEDAMMTRARWKVGYASPLDLKADEVAVSQARAALVQAENTTLQAQQFLNMVIGKPVSDPIKAEGDFSIAYQELAADSLVRRALAQRPEISALDRAEQIVGLSRSLARSAYSPSLVFVTSPTWSNPYQQVEGWGSSMSATLALEWLLYDGGKGLSEARAAGIQTKKLAYTRSQAEDGIELDVRQAHASWVEANEQVLVQQTLGAQMAELASMAKEQYRMGVISSLDYQSIQLSRTQVELARLAALYQLILAREKLNAAAWLWDAETLEEFETSKEDLK